MRLNLDAIDLFVQRDLREFLDQYLSEAVITQRVNALPREQFLATANEDLVDHFKAQFNLQPLIFREEHMVRDEPREIQLSVSGRADYDDGVVPGIHVKVSVPYSGVSDLWCMRPYDQWRLTARAEVTEAVNGAGWVRFDLAQPVGDSPERLRSLLDSQLRTVRETLQAQASVIAVAMSNVERYVQSAVTARRAALGAHDAITTALNIPFAPRSSAPSPVPVPLTKKLLDPSRTLVAKPEWGIATADYEYILKVLRHVGATFERTRRTYTVHDEEELRDILLAHLNGHLSGAAKAEAFSNQGKTDILVEYENRAAFIAECKMWYGDGKFYEAIAQLFSYTTWRDHKTALIVFNKQNARFSDLRAKVGKLLKEHPQAVRELAAPPGTEWRFEMTGPDDPGARITLHVFLFDLYASKPAA